MLIAFFKLANDGFLHSAQNSSCACSLSGNIVQDPEKNELVGREGPSVALEMECSETVSLQAWCIIYAWPRNYNLPQCARVAW